MLEGPISITDDEATGKNPTCPWCLTENDVPENTDDCDSFSVVCSQCSGEFHVTVVIDLVYVSNRVDPDGMVPHKPGV